MIVRWATFKCMILIPFLQWGKDINDQHSSSTNMSDDANKIANCWIVISCLLICLEGVSAASLTRSLDLRAAVQDVALAMSKQELLGNEDVLLWFVMIVCFGRLIICTWCQKFWKCFGKLWVLCNKNCPLPGESNLPAHGSMVKSLWLFLSSWSYDMVFIAGKIFSRWVVMWHQTLS